ncbi:hypothetical protein Zmor_012812 [Zophobas morio]|uniref:Uncharacterized protein n=1 Tax=Zophobas morio TaxID=2755281 RepID=A0AA38IE95_9CUCU|nr:hypothetical protein Zmor_012812 [Zophobas morio]
MEIVYLNLHLTFIKLYSSNAKRRSPWPERSVNLCPLESSGRIQFLVWFYSSVYGVNHPQTDRLHVEHKTDTGWRPPLYLIDAIYKQTPECLPPQTEHINFTASKDLRETLQPRTTLDFRVGQMGDLLFIFVRFSCKIIHKRRMLCTNSKMRFTLVTA